MTRTVEAPVAPTVVPLSPTESIKDVTFSCNRSWNRLDSGDVMIFQGVTKMCGSHYCKDVARIYVLKDPRTGKVRYVGSTSCELVSYLRARCALDPVQRWLLELETAGVEPIGMLLQEVSARDRYKAEYALIEAYEQTDGPLLNTVGTARADVNWEANRKRQTGRKATPETRALLSEQRRGRSVSGGHRYQTGHPNYYHGKRK